MKTDILMPFDYITQRKVKCFFKDAIIDDLQRAMMDKEYAHRKYISQKDMSELEEEQLRELPEISQRLKHLMHIDLDRIKTRK